MFTRTYTFSHEELVKLLVDFMEEIGIATCHGTYAQRDLDLAAEFLVNRQLPPSPLDALPPLGSADAALVRILREEAQNSDPSNQ